MINVKEATDKAKEYLLSFFADAENVQLEEVENPDEVDETYAGFSGSIEQDGRDLEILSLAEVRRRQIPPEGYEGFRKAIVAAQEWGDLKIRIVKEGK